MQSVGRAERRPRHLVGSKKASGVGTPGRYHCRNTSQHFRGTCQRRGTPSALGVNGKGGSCEWVPGGESGLVFFEPAGANARPVAQPKESATAKAAVPGQRAAGCCRETSTPRSTSDIKRTLV